MASGRGLVQMAGGTRLGVLLLAAALLAGAAAPARASVVLLDELWTPEITVNGVRVTEVDTEATGDPTQAVAGYFSAKLENETGAPNVRFRNAATVRPADLPPDQTEARLWYRTDKWNGKMGAGRLGLRALGRAARADADGPARRRRPGGAPGRR